MEVLGKPMAFPEKRLQVLPQSFTVITDMKYEE